MLGGFSLPYDGVNKREGGGGLNQMNRPPDLNPRHFIFWLARAGFGIALFRLNRRHCRKSVGLGGRNPDVSRCEPRDFLFNQSQESGVAGPRNHFHYNHHGRRLAASAAPNDENRL
jgi:hypothetical protein